MTQFAPVRKALGTILVACVLTSTALLIGQAATSRPALAAINVSPPTVDGAWVAVSPQAPISSLQVTRQNVMRGTTLLTRFIVQAFHGTQSVGTGSTAWEINQVGAGFGRAISVSFTDSCTTAPACLEIHTTLQLFAQTIVSLTLSGREQTLTTGLTWEEILGRPVVTP